LFPAILPRIAQREAAGGIDLGIAADERAAAHVYITVLDDDVGGSAAPDDVPGTHAIAGERAFDPWIVERAEHHSRELAVAADGNRGRGRAQGGEDPGKDAIGLLPVEARDVERDLRTLAPGSPAIERHVGL